MSRVNSRFLRFAGELLIPPSACITNKLGILDIYGFMAERLIKPRAAVLIYHHFENTKKYPWCLSSITVEEFEYQIHYLSQRYEFISLERLIQFIRSKETLSQRSVVITFDDGYKDNHTYAYPILKRYNVPATIFLTSGHINTGALFWWDKVGYVVFNTALESLDLSQLGAYSLRSTKDRLRAISNITAKINELSEEQKKLALGKLEILAGISVPSDLGKQLILSWDEVREMSENGISFGAHSVTHPILTKVSLEEANEQIIKSKQLIEKELGQDIKAFSYPNGAPGDYNDNIKRILYEQGFTCAVAGMPPRTVDLKDDVYEIGRIWAAGNFDVFKFYLKLFPDLRAMMGRVIRGT